MAPGPAAPGRSAALDAVRGLAVVAMVLGHTLDALLAPRFKQSTLFQLYSPFRGMTAPLFLFVSGWAVMTRALRQDQGRGGSRPWSRGQRVRVHLTRAAVLLLWALALRWPAWNPRGLWHGDRELWTHWLGPDALTCIACCLVLSAGVLSLTEDARRRGLLWLAIAAGAAAAAGLAVQHPLPLPWRGFFIASAESPFPLLPWVGHFAMGALIAVVLGETRSRAQGALLVLLLGLALLSSTALLGLDGLPLWSARLFAYRLGYVVSVAGGVLALPERWLRWTQPVGRASLLTYVLHLPLLYGWGSHTGLRGLWGESLAPLQALMLALIFVGAGTALGGLRTVLRFWTQEAESQHAPARNEAT